MLIIIQSQKPSYSYQKHCNSNFNSNSTNLAMKISISRIVFVLAIQLLPIKGYDVLKVALNYGDDHYCIDRWGNCCESWEWDFIQDRFYQMAANQRRVLRGNNETVVVAPINSTFTADRQLWNKACDNLCAGYAPGRCMAARCRGYRRGLMDSIMSTIAKPNDDERTLYWATSCDNQKSEVNNLLTNIKWQVGARCRSLLEAPREMSCLYNVDC